MSKITAWDRVMLARKMNRPKALDYINGLFDDFIELHGDRNFGDDKAIIGGIATFDGMPVTVIGEQKGKKAKENMERNFGMPNPEGYRKALRLMKQAEKFHRPIITFIDKIVERKDMKSIIAKLIRLHKLPKGTCHFGN